MNARPEIKEKLIEQKMLRWCRIAKWYPIDRRCPPTKARRNYWRLCKSHSHIMRRLGLSELSVYE